MPNPKPPATPPESGQDSDQGEPLAWSRRVNTRLARNVLLPATLLLIGFLGWQRGAQRESAIDQAQERLDRALEATGGLLAQRAQHFRTLLETLLAQEATDELLQHWAAEDLQGATVASDRIERSCQLVIEQQAGVLAIELHGEEGKLLLSVSGGGEPLGALDVSSEAWFDRAQRGGEVLSWERPGAFRVTHRRAALPGQKGVLIGSLVVDVDQLFNPALDVARNAIDGLRLTLDTDAGRLVLAEGLSGTTGQQLSCVGWITPCDGSLQIEQPLSLALAESAGARSAVSKAQLVLVLALLGIIWIGLQQTVLGPLSTLAAVVRAFHAEEALPPEPESPRGSPVLRPVAIAASRLRALASRSVSKPQPREDEFSGAERVLRNVIEAVRGSDSALRDQRAALERQITERDDRLNAHERNAQAALRARSDFLSGLSAGIQVPLAQARRANTELLGSAVTPDQNQLIHTVQDGTESAQRFLEQLEQLGRLEAGRFELDCQECEVHLALEEAVETVAADAHRKELDLTLEIHPGVPRCLAIDGKHLGQVISTLLDAMVQLSSQGEVVLRVSPTQDNGAEITLMFEIWGPVGQVNEPALRCALDPFTTTNGTLIAPPTPANRPPADLRLTLCGQLARQMQGEVRLKCSAAEGTTLWFSARVARPNGDAASLVEAAVTPLEGRRFLVLDDSATSLRMLGTQLTRWRANASCASDSQAAITMLEDSAQAEKPFDAALIDLRMPDQDGMALAEWIKSNIDFMELPLVLMLGGETHTEAVGFDPSLFSARLRKPVREMDLLRVLESVLPGQEDAVVDALLEDESEPEPPAKEWAPEEPARVLLAQRADAGQRPTAHVLRCLGYDLRTVATGAEALDALDAEPFHALLIDRDLAEPDAFVVAERIRSRDDLRASIPIIGLVPNATAQQRDRCMVAGMDDCIEHGAAAKTLGILLKRWVTLSSHLSPAELQQIAASCELNSSSPGPSEPSARA